MIRHTCITYFAKSKTGSKEKIKSYNQIKMCTCMGMMDMVRWILGPEWVLDITIYDECCGVVRWTLGLERVLVMSFEHVFPFVLHSPVSFGDIWRGVNHGTMHGALFGGIDG